MLARIASLLRPRVAMTESDIVQCQSGRVPACAVPAAESSLITSSTRREKRKPDVSNPPVDVKRQKPCCPGDQTDICDNDDQENHQQPSTILGASSGVEHPSRQHRSSLGTVLLTSIYWLQQGQQQPALVQLGDHDSPTAVPQEDGQLQAEASASADASAQCASPTTSSTPTVSQPSTAGQNSHHMHSASHQQFLQQEEELYHQQQVTSGASEDSEDLDYDEEDFDPFVFIAQLGPVEQYADPGRQPLLPCQTRTCKQKTLVLDLDETLVHSTLDAVCGAGSDFNFPVLFNGAEHMVHVRQRPHMREFLHAVAKDWEVVVFTASQKVYAEKLLNILDPQRQLIRHRIYRDSCVLVDGNYLKDLTVLGRDLSRCAIVDNSPQAFGFQVDNGIPIESWYDDPEDTELLQLLPFLSDLASIEVPDVRPRIKRKFNLENKIKQAYQVAYAMHMHQTAAVALLQPQQLSMQLQQMPQAQVQQA